MTSVKIQIMSANLLHTPKTIFITGAAKRVGAVIAHTNAVARWDAVTQTIKGGPLTIIAYQLIIEKDVAPHPNMIGKFGLSIYLPPSFTSLAIPDGFLEPGTKYKWEVLAIEESGNQTLSSGEFSTR